VARLLTHVMPGSVEVFEITPVVNGIPTVTVTLQRSGVEALEHDPNAAAEILKRATIRDGAARPEGLVTCEGRYPKLTWALKPYVAFSFFDPDNPLRVDFCGRITARYELRPGLVLSGSIKKRLRHAQHREAGVELDHPARPVRLWPL
jgi:hypothetical protein